MEVNEDYDYLYSIDERLQNFGDYFSVFDLNGVNSSLINHVENTNIDFTSSFVSYYDKDYQGYLNPFCKREIYSWQNEGRMLLHSPMFKTLGDEKPYIIKNLELEKVFSEKISITKLFSSKNTNEWFE